VLVGRSRALARSCRRSKSSARSRTETRRVDGSSRCDHHVIGLPSRDDYVFQQPPQQRGFRESLRLRHAGEVLLYFSGNPRLKMDVCRRDVLSLIHAAAARLSVMPFEPSLNANSALTLCLHLHHPPRSGLIKYFARRSYSPKVSAPARRFRSRFTVDVVGHGVPLKAAHREEKTALGGLQRSRWTHETRYWSSFSSVLRPAEQLTLPALLKSEPCFIHGSPTGAYCMDNDPKNPTPQTTAPTSSHSRVLRLKAACGLWVGSREKFRNG